MSPRKLLIVTALYFTFGSLCPTLQSAYGLLYGGGQQAARVISAYMRLTPLGLALSISAESEGHKTQHSEPLPTRKTPSDKIQ